MVLFSTEIIMTTVVIDEFKYSFFFWLDIIATGSLIPDIDWMRDLLNFVLFGRIQKKYSLDVIPGEIIVESTSQ